MWLPFTTVSIKIAGHTNTHTPKVLEIIRLTFSSDLRKPYCDLVKAGLLLEKFSVLEKKLNFVQLTH